MKARRGLLMLAPAALAGCSLLPDRPYQEVRRFALAPERPTRVVPPRTAPVLLVRQLRAAPALAARGLMVVDGRGQVSQEYWAEWAAPPAELAEEAMRRWLAASGLFAAVVTPGSRLRADLVLEGELVRLQAEPAQQRARVALSALLLADQREGGEARILAQPQAEGVAPLPANARPEAMAAALREALGQALTVLEQGLAAGLGRG